MLVHIVLSIILVSQAVALPNPIPGDTTVNPNAVTSTTCTNPGVYVSFLISRPESGYCCSTVFWCVLCSILNDHDINVALLQICGGIAGSIEQCQGTPTTTSGTSGDARFNLQVETTGTAIIITKGRWEGCVRAARAVCGDSPFSSTCIGGANDNKNNVLFQLVQQ